MSMPNTLARACGCPIRQERCGGAVATRARSEVFPPPYEVPFRLRRLQEEVALRLRDQPRRARSTRFCSESINSSDSSCVGSRGSRAPAFWENEPVGQKLNDCNTVPVGCVERKRNPSIECAASHTVGYGASRLTHPTDLHFSNVKHGSGFARLAAGPAASPPTPRRHTPTSIRPDFARPCAS